MKLIVAAMHEEATDIKGHDVLITGIGKVNAASKLTEAIFKNKIEAIYNIGIAGASHHYNVGDMIIIETAQYHDVDVTPFGYEKGQIPHFPPVFESDLNLVADAKKRFKEAKLGHLFTGDYFMTEAVDVPYIVDMEGTALYQVAHIYGIPMISIKIISDIVGEEDHIENYKSFEVKDAAKKLAEVVSELVKE